ncbi:MAG: hydroxyacid dehydrogenase [Lachnospiraceae bacterium]|jgi:D-3-phosphoglycerate dehydrogenase
MKVLVTEAINEKGIDLLKEHGLEVVMGTGIERDTVVREAQGCVGILTRNAHIDGPMMDEMPGLKVISMHGVGVDCLDVKAATERGIQITNAAKSNQEAVAEYTIGLILMLAKHSVDYNNGLKNYDMSVRNTTGSEVSGKTLGIIGMGNIGSQVAKIAAAGLNMKVIGYSRHITGMQPVSFGTLSGDMKQVISEADYLTLHVPGNASTHHMIGAEQLSWMKPTAYLINTARGTVVDEAALIEALQNKKIAGAALDVFEGNLPKPDNPLLAMPNVIVTPHTAAFTVEALERMSYQAALGIVEVVENKPISFPVNHLHDTFEDRKEVREVMDYFRYEFNIR